MRFLNIMNDSVVCFIMNNICDDSFALKADGLFVVKEDQREAISSCWWPTTMILQVTEIFISIQINFVHVNYYVEIYFHCLFFRSVFHVIFMVYSHWAVPGPRQEQWLRPEQWGIYVSTPVLVQVQCESFQTVSCNPFVPNSCPGLGSGQCEYTIIFGQIFDNRVFMFANEVQILITTFNQSIQIHSRPDVCIFSWWAQSWDQNHQNILPENAGGEYFTCYHCCSNWHDPLRQTGNTLSCRLDADIDKEIETRFLLILKSCHKWVRPLNENCFRCIRWDNNRSSVQWSVRVQIILL